MLKRFLLTLLSLCLLFGASAALAEDAVVSEPVEAAVPDAGEVWLDPQAEPAPARQVSAAKAARSPQVLEVTVANPIKDEYSWIYMYPLVMQKETVRFTVRTNTDAKYLYLLNSSGKKLKKWSASKAAKTVKVDGVKQRKWTVRYTFTGAGLKTVYFGASYGAKSTPTGKKAVMLEALEAPVIKSASCTPKKPEPGQEIKFTVKTNDAAQLLSILDSKGKPVEFMYGPYVERKDDGTRVITGSFSLKEGGRQKVTFKASYIKNRGVAKKSVTLTVKDSTIHSASFFNSSVYAGDAIKAQVVTGTEAVALALFNDKDQLLADWEADKCSTIMNGERVWTVETAFQRIGKHKYSFRTRTSPLDPYMGDDAAQFNAQKNVSITVKGKKIVDVTYTDCAMARRNSSGWIEYMYYQSPYRLRDDRFLASADMLLVQVIAADNIRYVHIYNENGKQVARLKVDEQTRSYQELESPKQWYVPVYLMKGAPEWGSTFTVKVSVDGTNVGAGKTFSITGVDPEPIVPGGSVDMYISAVNYYEESFSALSFKAPESRTYTFWVEYPGGSIHYLLYRAGSNEILRDGVSTRSADGSRESIQLDAQAGLTYVLRLDLQDCGGEDSTIHCS